MEEVKFDRDAHALTYAHINTYSHIYSDANASLLVVVPFNTQREQNTFFFFPHYGICHVQLQLS